MKKVHVRVGGWRTLKQPGEGQTSRTPLWPMTLDIGRAMAYDSSMTKSRSASMLKLIGLGLVLYVLWEPIRPIRQVTAEVLAYTAEQIRR